MDAQDTGVGAATSTAIRVAIRPVRWADLPEITRMTHANMTGADRQFTQLVNNPLFRLTSYLTLPIYLMLAGKGYKAVAGGQILGSAYLHLRRRSGYIFNVSVRSSHRRQGVASQLMRHLESVARARQRSWAVLEVDDGNTPAQRLYERLGYRPYHPDFLRREGPSPVQRVFAEGVSLERLPRNQGKQLYSHYLNVERQAGDPWVIPVIGEYESKQSAVGPFWRLDFQAEEIGCAWNSGSDAQPRFRLALKPEFWGHVAIGGMVRMLEERLNGAHPAINLYLGSSRHHEVAAPLLNSLGYERRSLSRILMLKALG